jgi:peptidoglycan/xylan/chitin deacetylase (PgdA/CDA1 family)
MTPNDPFVVIIGHSLVQPDFARISLACDFCGFRVVRCPSVDSRPLREALADVRIPVLLLVSAHELKDHSPENLREIRSWAEQHGVPIAVIGIEPNCASETLVEWGCDAGIRSSAAGHDWGLWVTAAEPTDAGFELRGLRFDLGGGPSYGLEYSTSLPSRALAKIGPSEAEGRPALLRLDAPGGSRYFLSGGVGPDAGDWKFRRSKFGEIVPMLILLREVGGDRCWHPPALLANLTIDDPRLIEPYGSLSYPGLLAEMRRERFHSTIGFIPWNYDRNSAEVVELVKANPDCFTIAVHGNNHDRYEFFRYETQAGDNQRPKPLAAQAFNLRQALARMEVFRRRTALDFDRVMVFPHGVCPAPTFGLLKQNGFWATSNYSNVPLGESPPPDAATALRAVNAEWHDFPALRRNYPENLSQEAIAVDLFLGNPVLFMAHQDLFFGGVDAFTAYACQLNVRQPAVQWMGLGEISRQLHLFRWLGESRCEVRLFSCHARIQNPRFGLADFHFSKRESGQPGVARVTVDGVETAWSLTEGQVRFVARLPARGQGMVEIHYALSQDPQPIAVHRHGFRNRCLRLIAEARDLILPHSVLGRLLTRKYYRQGKHRPTLRSLFFGRWGKITRPGTSRPKA